MTNDVIDRTFLEAIPPSRGEAALAEIRSGVERIGVDLTAERLSAMSLADRKRTVAGRYPTRKRWAKVRPLEPTPADMIRWAETEFPDRHELGLLFGDLRHLDEEAYQKVQNWRRGKRDGTPFNMPPEFGFPQKREINDAIIEARAVPTLREASRSLRAGEPCAVIKYRLNAMNRNRERRAQTRD